MYRSYRRKAAGESSLAPVLLLVLIVALPTAAVLWLVREATENERLAVRQRLADVYRIQLEATRQRIAAGWQQSLTELDKAAADLPPARAFAACMRRGIADSVIVLDKSGQPSYPAHAAPSVPSLVETVEKSPPWLAARQLEFGDRNYSAAAEAYEEIARDSRNDSLVGIAIQAEVRSWLEAGDKQAAVKILSQQIESSQIQVAIGPDGRQLWIDLMLLLVQTATEIDPPLAAKATSPLRARLEDYDHTVIPPAQRRFAQHELQRLVSGSMRAPTLAAEDLAAEYLEQVRERAVSRDLQPAGIENVWKVFSPGGRVLALFRTPTIATVANQKLDEQRSPLGVKLSILDPRADADQSAFLIAPLGAELPLWRIALTLKEDPFSEAATERSRAYFWTAALTLLATAALALLAAIALRRQMRLSRLKNDLVATVSHELKTPLSAMRLLVDTLLDQEHSDPSQTREYLQLVAQENLRLSRLIDNFLTFSRLERGKQRFAAEPVDPAEVAHRVIDSLRDRLYAPACDFEALIEPNLPPIKGDIDALVMALINLLDNAIKYTDPEKRIVLRVSGSTNEICFSVSDNGIGLSPRQKRRVFDRFYQVDRRLARAAGGCGLGLSIVKSIVVAHGGNVEVLSEVGRGSTFTVKLPALNLAQRREGSCTAS
jgi:signal transduction histidine kinase